MADRVMADRVKVYVLDPDGTAVGLIGRPTGFSITQRWVDLGSLSVDCRASDPAAQEIRRGSSLAVLLDGKPFASGPIVQKIRTEDRDGDVLTCNGPDDLIRLKWRLTAPAAPSFNPNAAASDDRTGIVEDVIYAYANANAGPGALDYRRNIRVSPSLHRGSTVNESARFDPLLEVVTRLAIIDGFGITCRWDPEDQGLPLFTVETSRDLRFEVQFSKDRRTISKYTLTDTGPGGTHVLVGGSGEGTARNFALVENDEAAADWYRVETFVDGGDTSDPAVLTQRATADIQQAGYTLEFDAAETEGLAYGDWKLGDIVTGVAGGVSDVYVIVELKVSGPPLRIVPTLAQFAGFRLGQLSAVRDRIMAQRVRSLETRT